MNANGTWPYRLEAFNLNDHEIRRRVELKGESALGLEENSPHLAAKLLQLELEKVFFLSRQGLVVIRKMLADCEGHLTTYYSNSLAYLRAMNGRSSPFLDRFPICLTGLAGVGKSAIARAIYRLMNGTTSIQLGSGYGSREFRHVVHIKLKEAKSTKDLLQIFQLDENSVALSLSISQLREHLSRQLHGEGLALLIVDEFQFQSLSAAAYLSVTKKLLTLSFIGVPLMYIGNFSLVQKLMTRDHEVSDILCADPVVVYPEPLDDPVMSAIYTEYNRLSSGAIPADACFIEQVAEYTFNLHRGRIVLLTAAYLHARVDGRHVVNSSDLKTAFFSTAFHKFRVDVQDLRTLVLTGRAPAGKKSLECPFSMDAEFLKAAKAVAQKLDRKRTQEAAAHSSLTPDEVKEKDALSGEARNKERSPKKATPKPTLGSLIERARPRR